MTDAKEWLRAQIATAERLLTEMPPGPFGDGGMAAHVHDLKQQLVDQERHAKDWTPDGPNCRQCGRHDYALQLQFIADGVGSFMATCKADGCPLSGNAHGLRRLNEFAGRAGPLPGSVVAVGQSLAPARRTEELLAAIRAHPHFGAVLGQFEVDAREGLEDEQYEGESKERSELWAACYELLSGKPMPCARCSEPAVPCPNGICGPTYCLEHWWGWDGGDDGGDDE